MGGEERSNPEFAVPGFQAFRLVVSDLRLRVCGLTRSGGGGASHSRRTWLTYAIGPFTLARPDRHT